jgi:hypothetical protein
MAEEPRKTSAQRIAEEAAAGPYRLRIPQFDNVVHILPDRLRSPGERAHRRRARIQRMASTPLPGGVKDVQDFMAAYDDIQDGFVTLAMTARLATRFYPPAERTAHVLATITDVLNLGPAGLALAPLRKPAKPHLANKYKSMPNTYRLRLKDTIRSGKWNARLTEWLQVAQTSSSIFSVGLTLGGIMAVPPTAAALAFTGGELELNPFPYDEGLMKEYLGPWERSARLRSNPPLRAQVAAAKAAALQTRRDHINRILRQDAITSADRKTLNRLYAQGDTLTPAELAAALDRDGTIEMPKLFGLPALRDHFIGTLPGIATADVLRDARILTTRDLEARGIRQEPPRGPITPADTQAFVQGLYVQTRELLQAATRTLNGWKKIFKSHQSLTAEEHLDALAALLLAWQIIGPWFGAFGYDLTEDFPQAAIDSVPEILDATTRWTDELPTSDHREVAQQLLAEIPRLMMRALTDIRTPPVESLTPLAGFAALMVEMGGVAKPGGFAGGARIDSNSLGAIVSPGLWSQLTDAERQAVLSLFDPGSPTAAPPDRIIETGLAETLARP